MWLKIVRRGKVVVARSIWVVMRGKVVVVRSIWVFMMGKGWMLLL